MASSPDNLSMAVFCDFENVALGVRDAKYDKFDIKPVLERLLLKGSIVVKKAYCDWDRYKSFKAGMHEANFELIEIPHVRQSGKNSADIRLVVDALDLCYTKSHVNTFVIISGDSDFSPLVSKLRENAKQVIGVGIKQSTSDLLVANCDEFIFYDDLVRESRRAAAGRGTREAQPATRRTPEEEQRRREEKEARRNQAIEIAVHTFDALVSERGDSGKIWASLLKEAIKRRKPDFSESYYGFRTFGNLLEEAQARGLLEFSRDEKSGTYVYKGNGAGNAAAALAADKASEQEKPAPATPLATMATAASAAEEGQAKPERRRSRGGRKPAAKKTDAHAASPRRASAEQTQAEPAALAAIPAASQADHPQPASLASAPVEQVAIISEGKAEKKPARKTSGTGRAKTSGSGTPPTEAAPAKAERKPATRARRPRKAEAADE
ncbi:NYN domain-containing protein [Undibacterium sp.]|uniref:NYN domain-containing protein n=1 Tax=Undibacterium sp. TaxID=1914977 RepID=UPI002BA86CED|nr:NYN domain-containing protein [Undibacterium sp.]HTD05554.1 NYN domain-containing protein [Undibacterium sp.]